MTVESVANLFSRNRLDHCQIIRTGTVLQERPENERLDLGCAVASGTFEVLYPSGERIEILQSEGEIALIYFFFCLLERLQSLGTVSAIDYSVYTNKVLLP